MSEKQEEVLAILNTIVQVRIAPSEIHGVGIIAMRDIPKGTKLFAGMFPRAYKIPYGSRKKLRPEVRELLLERNPNMVNNKAFMWPDTHIQAYMNHSDDPNYDAHLDITLKDINKGEEVTEDYRKIANYDKVFHFLKS